MAGRQSPGLMLWALRGEAVRLEVRCCRDVSPLSLCKSVPKYLCYLKIQTKCQITMVPLQLSIFLLEDLDQRPKNKLAMEVQISLLLGCKTQSRRDWSTWAVLLCMLGLLCGEIGWWPHRDAFHLLISVVQVHLWNQVTTLNSVVTTGVQTGFVNLCSTGMPDSSFMSIAIV